MDEGDLLTAPIGEGLQTPPHQGEDVAVQRFVSRFLASVTDEFRTPLAALNASVEYLLDDLDLLSTSEIRELLRSVHLSVTGLQTLIDNLIESTRIEAGHFSIRSGPIDLGKVILEAICFTRPLTDRRRQRIIVEQPSTLPLVFADPARLTQVMVNLLSHASKSGPMSQTIRVCLETGGNDQVRVLIADQGPGWLPEEQARLFGRSARPTMTGDRPYGLELSLNVAQSIIEEHGGSIGVELRPGGGSILWFTVPTVTQIQGD